MAAVDILNGIYTDSVADFRVALPKNLMVIPLATPLSRGYLKPADGIIQFGTGPGKDRGGINWNGVCYRVMGTKLVSVSANGTVTTLGDVGIGNQCSFDYSFDRLAITSGGRLYYYYAGSVTQVTDADLGSAIDVQFIDGYFMTTDGTSLVVTELNDPFSVNPLKYGSSEVDPDPVKGLQKIRNEIYAVNRYTIEAFQDVGGDFFPFQRIEGAMVERGAVGTYANCVFLESIAFLGSSRNEPLAVWLASNGQSINISSREVDLLLSDYAEVDLSNVILESRVNSGQKLLYMHLPDRTLVYDASASQVLGEPIWTVLSSSEVGYSTYRARNFVWCYDKWIVGDPISFNHGYFSSTTTKHYGNTIGWEFSTSILYKNGTTAVLSEMELVCTTGRTDIGVNPTVWTSYTTDGVTWSQEKYRSLGLRGETNKRITWFQQGFLRNWRCQKFRGNSDSIVAIARLELRAT